MPVANFCLSILATLITFLGLAVNLYIALSLVLAKKASSALTMRGVTLLSLLPLP